jgi:hypothetical protein
MANAQRIPASEKKPEDFLPPVLPPVVKKVVSIVVTRASGDTETTTVILRPGDVASIDGQPVAEG